MLLVWLLPCCLSLYAVSTNRCYDPKPEEYPPCEAVRAINPEAYYQTGPLPDDSGFVLPNNRWITPLGTTIKVDNLPLALVLSPDGRYLFAANSGLHDQVITVIDTESARVIERLVVPALFLGLVMNSSGDTLYAAGGGSNVVAKFSFISGHLQHQFDIPLDFFPTGLTLSADDRYLYGTNQLSGQLSIIDTESATSIGNAYVGGRPYDVALAPDGNTAYVSCTMDNYIALVDISRKEHPYLRGVIPTGKNPEDLLISPNGEFLFVANADQDSIGVISIPSETAKPDISLRAADDSAYGVNPNALAINAAGTHLFIAAGGENRIVIYDILNQTFLGSIPTGWYPAAVAVNADETRLYVANAKGQGSVRGRAVVGSIPGTISLIDLSDAFTNLGEYTARAEENNTAPSRYFDLNDACEHFPAPVKRGNDTPINHVIYILRENKTYDAIFGDDERGNGDPSLTLFGEWYTPNIHALARQFVSLDNFYNNAEESTEGHEWSLGAVMNDYTTKNMLARERGENDTATEGEFYVELFLNPVTYPKLGFIFPHCLKHGIPFMSYGETLGLGDGCLEMETDLPQPTDCLYADPRYVHVGPLYVPFFNTAVKDIQKIDEVIADIDHGKFPPFVFMSLPNDHTNGTTPGFPTPPSMVADNDLATGKIIDYISHSPYWKETLIIILEDDPQTGYDHVEPHRSICVLVSPYVKRGYVSSIHANEVNLLKTLEMILGLPPMSIHDEAAQAMYDVFTSVPDFTPYNVIPRNVPEEYNLPDNPLAAESAKIDFSVPDASPRLHDIIWQYMKGNKGGGTE
jgi:YVTN family beta-propeller protein